MRRHHRSTLSRVCVSKLLGREFACEHTAFVSVLESNRVDTFWGFIDAAAGGHPSIVSRAP